MPDLLQEFGFPQGMSPQLPKQVPSVRPQPQAAPLPSQAPVTGNVPLPRPRPNLEQGSHIEQAQDIMRQGGFLPDESKQETSSDEGFWSLAGHSLVQATVAAGQETAAGAAAT